MRMGLDSLSQLPAIADFVPGADVVEALEIGLRIEVDVDAELAERAGARDDEPDSRPALDDLLDGDGPG
jgi:segregation and condensation protein B